VAHELYRAAVYYSFASDMQGPEMGEKMLSYSVAEVWYLAGSCVQRNANAALRKRGLPGTCCVMLLKGWNARPLYNFVPDVIAAS